MARCPHAIWDPLGPQAEPRMTRHDIVCLHTMAGSLEGVRAMFKVDGYGGTESHFGVGGSGRAYQWQDTAYQADANLDGNHRVLSIETADRGESFPSWTGSDVPKWTEAQMNKIVDIVAWACKTYNIPPRLIPDTKPGRRGIGFHRQGIDPWRVDGGERWSSSAGKVCPGDRRIAQLKNVVIPAVQKRLSDWDYIASVTGTKTTRRFETLRDATRFVAEKVKKGARVVLKRVRG